MWCSASFAILEGRDAIICPLSFAFDEILKHALTIGPLKILLMR